MNTQQKRKSICCGLLVAIGAAVLMIDETHSAAIPMWEYLSKDEKMSYLYSMFANQVEDFCEFSDMNDCNRELLKFGLGKLKDMPEDHLDTMDPYQRGAHSLIWDSMMEGHEMMDKSKQRPASSSSSNNKNNNNRKLSSSTPQPNSYEDDQFNSWKAGSNSNNGGDYQSQASAKIETVVYRLPPPKGFVVSSGPSQYVSPLKGGYAPPNGLSQTASYPTQYQQYAQHEDAAAPPLTGPMVVKVHLDGTPVQEKTHLPQDEDLKQYKMSKATIPTF